MGIPVEKLQPLMQAMDLVGVSSHKLESSLGRLSSAVGSALQSPTSQAANAFRELGISQQELKNGDIEQIMKDAAAGFAKYGESASKTAAIRSLFGKQGPELVAAMKEEAAAEQQVKETQEAYGTAISETDAKSARYFTSTLKLGMTMFQGVGLSITHSLLPGLQVLVDQFAESGKQGGIMRDILDGVSTSITFVAKVIMSSLYEPLQVVILLFKQAGTVIGATMAAISEAVHGHLDEAKQTMVNMGHDLVQMQHDYEASTSKFEAALWKGAAAVKEQSKAVDDAKPKFHGLDSAAIKTGAALEHLSSALSSQRILLAGATQGLDEYKAAQNQVAINTEVLKLKKDGASAASIAHAEALMRETQAAKTATSEEVAGHQLLVSLQLQVAQGTAKQTELDKVNAQIAKENLDTENAALAAKLRAEAQAIDQKKQGVDLDKITEAYSKNVYNAQLHYRESLVGNATEIKNINTLLKLQDKYQKDIGGKAPQEIAKITAAYKQEVAQMKELQALEQQHTTSFQGMADGAVKGLQQIQQQATNLNQLGLKAATTLTDGLTNSFIKMEQGGKNAFAGLLTSLGQLFAQQILHFGIVEAELAVLSAFGITGPSAAVIIGGPVTKSANGNVFNSGSVVPFANGGVVGGPTLAPMALFGEAGPEAIMPLQRDSSGKLGVSMASSGNSSSPNTVHYHAPNITINSNQDPHEIAKQTQKVLHLHQAMIKQTIAKEQRVGGMLHQQSPMLR